MSVIPAPICAGAGAQPVRLDTRARFRALAWPRYDVDEDLDVVFGPYAEVLRELGDVTLCLHHDARADGPLEQASAAIARALARHTSERPGLDILLVDNVPGSETWPALGRAVSWVLAPPSSDEGRRAEFVARVGVPVVRDATELRHRFEGTPLPWHRPRFTAELDVRSDRPNLFLLRGKSGQGKTSLAVALLKSAAPFKVIGGTTDSLPTLATLIGTDRIYVQFVQRHLPDTVPAYWKHGHHDLINRHYLHHLDDEQRGAFRQHLLECVDAALSSTRRHVILEGWHLLSLGESVIRAFETRANIVPVDVERYVARVGQAYEHDATDLQDGPDKPGNAHAARELLRYVKQHTLHELVPRTTYQCYDDLGQAANNSRSRAKLEALNLPPLSGLRVLDVGCNAGYFSIRLRERGARSVLGVDTSEKDLQLARVYRDVIYELDEVVFDNVDVFDLPDKRAFDLVISLSVFHYFRERQQEFLDKIRCILDPGGLLVLECGLSERHPERAFVEKAARRVDADNPCYFPNEKALRRMARGFRLEFRGPSTMQPGDAMARSVLHLRRI